jgi:CubicO group peptidase (beta-lactamase class C family)
MIQSDDQLDAQIKTLLRRRVDAGRPQDLEAVLRAAMTSPAKGLRSPFLTWPALGGLGAVIVAVVVIALITSVLRPAPDRGPAASVPASPESTAPAIVVPIPTATSRPSHSAATSSPTAASGRTARVDALFNVYSANTPGCAVAIVDGGTVAYANAYGLADLSTKRPLSTSSVFLTAGASSGIVVTLALMLAAEHHLDLGQDVRTYIPELPDYGLKVTVRDLVDDTSGIRNYFGIMAGAGVTFTSDVEPADILRALSTEKTLESTPGTHIGYSNSNAFLLSLIVERVSGEPFQTVAQARLLAPLGMASSFFRTNAAETVPNGVTNYASDSGSGTFVVSPFRWQTLGNGNLETSVLDVARWAQTYLDDSFGDAQLRAARLAPIQVTISNGYDGIPGMLVDTTGPDHLLYAGGATRGSFDELTIDLTRHAAATVACNLLPKLDPPPLTQVILDSWFQGP